MKINDPRIVKIRSIEDVKTNHISYEFSVTFVVTVAVDLNLVDCDPNKALMLAKETGVKLLENEIAKHVSAE